jgi:hypothetical protein
MIQHQLVLLRASELHDAQLDLASAERCAQHEAADERARAFKRQRMQEAAAAAAAAAASAAAAALATSPRTRGGGGQQ